MLEQMQLVARISSGPSRSGERPKWRANWATAADITVDGPRRVVAQAEVVEEALAQRGHGSPPNKPGERWSKQGNHATQTARAQVRTIATTATVGKGKNACDDKGRRAARRQQEGVRK